MSYRVKIDRRKFPKHREIVQEELLKAAIRCENQYKENLETGQGAAGIFEVL